MKKLIYNENTKEIDVIEQEIFLVTEKKKQRRAKTWLEKNKIYFEIFSYFFVGVMSIILSFLVGKLIKGVRKYIKNN